MTQDDKIKEVAGNVVEALAGIEESFRLAKLELLKNEAALLQPLYAKRSKLTSAIPRFWSTVLSIEDELLPYIKEQEADLLKSCYDLKIERMADPRDFTLSMSFSKNAYLETSSLNLTKHFKFEGGRLTSNVVKLDWKAGKSIIQSAQDENRLSFFSLLAFTGTEEEWNDPDEEDPQLILEDMAMLLADEIYPHALSYFTDALAPDTESGTSTPLESMSHSFLDAQAATTTTTTGQGKNSHLTENFGVIEAYAERKSSQLPQYILSHREESINAFNEVKMITTNEAQFLHFLVSMHRNPKVLEIGCFTGFSALVMADAGAVVTTLELDPELSSFAKLAIHKAGKSVDVITGDAHKTILTLKETYDIIFIDAEKEGYCEYLRQIKARKLLSKGGLIIADNTLRRGQVAMEFPGRHKVTESPALRSTNDEFEAGVIAIREFNDMVAADSSLSTVVVPCWDGVTLIKSLVV